MKKIIFSVACALALTSCGTVGLVGAVYTGYTEPAAVTSNELGTKVGQAKAVSVLGIAAAGDAGIEKASKKAGITKVSHVDKKVVSVLGLFTKVTYTVYGE
ncbi:MAG: TRL-like family protein [Paludibacteraceae bacterium]|nr:TRL-like family protein [Paludibacteraceae bacterium]